MQAIFQNFGIYLHVPFCVKNCSYCRFYKTRPDSSNIGAYVRGLEKEIDWLRCENLGKLPVPDTMYWGGGTPSILPERHLEGMADMLSELIPTLEWTVEVDPLSATKRKLEFLKNLGVTRISLGVQSFNPDTLSALGRAHSLESTLRAVDTVGECSFKHFSIDLIFAAPGQELTDFYADMLAASNTGADHVSAYCLEFESGTSCCGGVYSEGEYLKRRREAGFMELAMATLPRLGFEQYEISNYAKPGCECIHNLSTWHMAQWLGLGPGAASQWRGVRRKNVSSIDKWIGSIESGKPAFEDVVELCDDEMFSSSLVFGLRMCSGVDLTELSGRFPGASLPDLDDKLAKLEDGGLILRERNGNADRVRLTLKGRLLADAVAVEIL